MKMNYKRVLRVGVPCAFAFCLGMYCMHWWAETRESTQVPRFSAIPAPIAPQPPRVTPFHAQEINQEQAHAIVELKSEIDTLEQQLAAYKAELLDLTDPVEDEGVTELDIALSHDLMKQDFAMQTKTGISPEQQRLLESFFMHYTGPADEMLSAYKAHLEEVLSEEQLQALKDYHLDQDDAIRTKNAATGLSELQTLFQLDDEQKDAIYLALYDNLPFHPLTGPGTKMHHDYMKMKMEALEEILTEKQMEIYRDFHAINSAEQND